MPPSLSVPLISAQACDAEMKKAELNCKGSTASSLVNSGDSKTAAMWILRTCVALCFSTQKTV